MKKHRPTICILDNNRERCLRQEQLLDKAIASKNVFATGISNFGDNYLARTGLKKFPAIEVDGIYFSYKEEHEEYTYTTLCDFLDMLIRKSVISSL